MKIRFQPRPVFTVTSERQAEARAGPSQASTSHASVFWPSFPIWLLVSTPRKNSDAHTRTLQPLIQFSLLVLVWPPPESTPAENQQPPPITTRAAEASGNCSSGSQSPNALPGSARSAAIVPRADACKSPCPLAVKPSGLVDAD